MKATNTATTAGNQGQKCQSDVIEDDAAISCQYKSPPPKKGRFLPATDQKPRPVPRPLPKKSQAAHVEPEKSSECCNTKKKSSEVANISDHDTADICFIEDK